MIRALLAIIALISFSGTQTPPPEFDLVVYGGTSAGVIAAVQAKRIGKSVVIVGPDKHLGGLSSGGLGFTDTGNKAVIGGLSREFYQRIWQHYNEPEAWKWQKREEYGNKGQGTPAIDGAQRTMWIFEPQRGRARVRGSRQGTSDPRRSQRVARPRQGRREGRRAHRLDHHAEREDVHRADVHRRHLRGRSDGGRRRRLSRRPRSPGHVRREVERRPDRRAAPSPSLRRPERADQPLRRARRSEERRAAAHQHGEPRRVRRRPTSACRPTAIASA